MWQDPGSFQAYVLLCVFSSAVVLLTNIPLLTHPGAMVAPLSNDPAVREWLEPLLWVLAVHIQALTSHSIRNSSSCSVHATRCCQGRVAALTAKELLIPLGRPWLAMAISYASSYLVAVTLSDPQLRPLPYSTISTAIHI